MAQLLAAGIIVLGLLILASGIFIASRENKLLVSSSTTTPKAEPLTPTPEPTLVPVAQEPEAKGARWQKMCCQSLHQ